jgi:hypothetical protein
MVAGFAFGQSLREKKKHLAEGFALIRLIHLIL